MLDHLAFKQNRVQGLRHREQSDRHQHDLDAVEQFRHAAGIACLAGDLVHADKSRCQTDKEGRQAAHGALPQYRADRGECQQHQHKVFRRTELDSKVRYHRREQRHQHGGNGARHEGANGRCRQRGASAAALGHLVAFHGRDHAGRLTGRVEQDGGGRAAIHGAVVNAGEEDHGGGRIHLGGDGQQHGHGGRRTNAGQHTHGGTQGAADKGPQQVDRRTRRHEALQKLVPDVHQSHPPCVSPGKLMARNCVNIQYTGAAISKPVTVSLNQGLIPRADCP